MLSNRKEYRGKSTNNMQSKSGTYGTKGLMEQGGERIASQSVYLGWSFQAFNYSV